MAEDSTFEDRVFQGIVEQFFKPLVTGWDMNGNPLTGPSPLTSLATELYRLHKDRLSHDIWAYQDKSYAITAAKNYGPQNAVIFTDD